MVEFQFWKMTAYPPPQTQELIDDDRLLAEVYLGAVKEDVESMFDMKLTETPCFACRNILMRPTFQAGGV